MGNPSRYNTTGWRETDARMGRRHSIMSTCWGGQPLPLACYFADQGQAGDQIKVLVLGELGPGAREAAWRAVCKHTPATEGKDKWAGASAEQGQKQESRQWGILTGRRRQRYWNKTLCCRTVTTLYTICSSRAILSGRKQVSHFFYFLASGQIKLSSCLFVFHRASE